MAFRSDLEAAQARAAALQQEVSRLEAENARLRNEEPAGEANEAAETDDPANAGKRERRSLVLAGIAAFAIFASIAVVFVMIGATPFAVVVGAMGASVGAVLIALSQVVHIVPPGFVLVLSGGQPRNIGGGRMVGYRIVRGAGRAVRMPIIESATLLDCRLRTFEAHVSRAYTKGNLPVSVTASVTAGLAPDSPRLDNAIERFLGRGPGEVDRVVRETIEGHLRGVLAVLTIDEVRQDPVRFANELIEEAEGDMVRLGIHLDDIAIADIHTDR